MNRLAHFASVRLAVGGYASLALVVWLAFVPGSVRGLLFGDRYVEVIPMMVSGAISVFILVVLLPVLRYGPSRSRWLAAILVPFPVLTIGAIALWLIGSRV